MDARKLTEIRKSMGLTQNGFADLLGVTFVTVNRWENGRQKPSALALAKLYQVQAKEERRKDRSVSL